MLQENNIIFQDKFNFYKFYLPYPNIYGQKILEKIWYINTEGILP